MIPENTLHKIYILEQIKMWKLSSDWTYHIILFISQINKVAELRDWILYVVSYL